MVARFVFQYSTSHHTGVFVFLLPDDAMVINFFVYLLICSRVGPGWLGYDFMTSYQITFIVTQSSDLI